MHSKTNKMIGLSLLSFVLILLLSINGLAYTTTTDSCILCHSGGEGGAPYKRPHNDTVMCEKCHNAPFYFHSPESFIQPDGTFGNKTTAATCADCHETGVPGFSNAPMIPNLKHSAKVDNGSIWGPYWDSARRNDSCYYCHGNTKHDVVALGKINNLIGEDPTNIKNGSTDTTTWCADCHYNDTANIYYKGDQWNPVPPLINIKNTDNNGWVNHGGFLTSGYGDIKCESCHPMSGTYQDTSKNYVHSVDIAAGEECIQCHGTNYTGESPSATITLVDIGLFGGSIHQDINNSVPPGYVTNDDCWMCHYNRNMDRNNVRKCGFCHEKASQWHGNANVTTNMTVLSNK